MTTEPFTDDELLSSYLDGEATSEQVARIETEPDLGDRLAELRAAKELVSIPVAPLAEGAADHMIDIALAAADSSAAVGDLARARARRARRNVIVLAAAAGVLILAVAVPLVRAIDMNGGAETAEISTADPPADDAAADTAGDTVELEPQSPGADSTASDDDQGAESPEAAGDDAFEESGFDAGGLTGPVLANIDSVDDVDALEVIVTERLRARSADDTSEPPAASTTVPQAVVVCLEQMQAFADGEPLRVLESAEIEIDGVLTAVAFVESSADLALLSAPLATCAPVSETGVVVP